MLPSFKNVTVYPDKGSGHRQYTKLLEEQRDFFRKGSGKGLQRGYVYLICYWRGALGLK